MKHAGSNDRLHGLAKSVTAQQVGLGLSPLHIAGQSRASILIALTLAILLVAIIVDAPVRALAQSLDPSLKITLRYITGFGNSAWPLGIGLALLGMVWFLRRRKPDLSPIELSTLRSVLILLVSSVAISGFLASLSKHIIGRIRPSTDPDAQVLEFVVMAFQSGWAAFPSGHATTATAAAVALSLCFPRQAWALLALGLFAALSRALLGVHWFSDCLAGVALGGWVTMMIHRTMVGKGHQLDLAPGVLRLVLVQVAVECSSMAVTLARTLWTSAFSRAKPASRR